MRIIISSLLLILALHFLLQGINYRKYINLCNNEPEEQSETKNIPIKNIENLEINKSEEDVENIDVKQELLRKIQCKESPVVASNKYIDNKNDANFQSNVLNVNRFYKKNENSYDVNDFVDDKKDKDSKNINSFSNISQYSNEPSMWNYKDEFVMNGGELLKGVTGYDNLVDQHFSYSSSSLLSGCSSDNNCSPPLRGANINDDLRMGLGKLNSEIRRTT